MTAHSELTLKGGQGATSNHGTAQVLRGDARSIPLADKSVDLVVTSPP